MNSSRSLRPILDLNYDEKLEFTNDFTENWCLKRGMKEDEHYKLVDRETWEILFNQYGAHYIIPKISVAVETEDPLRPDYIVENQWRVFEIVSIPKVKYFQRVMANDARISRSDTIKEVI